MYYLPIFVYDPHGEDTRNGLPGWEDTLPLPDGYESWIDIYVEQAQLQYAQLQGFDFYPEVRRTSDMVNNKRSVPLYAGRLPKPKKCINLSNVTEDDVRTVLDAYYNQIGSIR